MKTINNLDMEELLKRKEKEELDRRFDRINKRIDSTFKSIITNGVAIVAILVVLIIITF